MSTLSKHWKWAGPLMVGLAIAGASAGRFDNGFVYDDIPVIVEGDLIHDWANVPAVFAHHTLIAVSEGQPELSSPVDTYRPVTLLTFMWDSTLSGRDPWSYHVTNWLTHLLCALLVFLLARELLPPARRGYALFAAACFGLTPLLAEAHVWINGRSDLFCTLFGLSAILLWRRACGATSRAWTLHGLAAVLFLLGLLSKEVLIMVLPALLLWPGQAAVPWRRRLARVAPLAACGALYLALRAAVLGGMRTHRDGEQLLQAASHLPALILDGVAATLVPTRVYLRSLVDDYAGLSPWVLGAFGVLLVVIAAALVRFRRQWPVLAWSALWFAVTLAPAAMISTMMWPGFGRYLYLPFAGLACGLGEVAARTAEATPRMRWALGACAVAYVAMLGAQQAMWTSDFKDDVTLFTATARSDPDSPHGHGFLGITLIDQERYVEAVPPLHRAVTLAPDRHTYLIHLGQALWLSGQDAAAHSVAERGIEQFRGRAEAASYHLLYVNTMARANPEEAVAHLIACLRAHPGRRDCLEALRVLTQAHDEHAQYRDALRRALEGQPPQLQRTLAPLVGR